MSFRCDGKLDCGDDDSSDELGCTTLQPTIPSASTKPSKQLINVVEFLIFFSNNRLSFALQLF